MPSLETSSAAKWPKVLPPLTPEQQQRSDQFMKIWHVELAGKPRYGLIREVQPSLPGQALRRP